MKYELHQIHLTDEEHDKVNAEGHDSVEKHKLHCDMRFSENEESIAKEAWDKGYYTHVSNITTCLLYTSPSPRDQRGSRMPSSA